MDVGSNSASFQLHKYHIVCLLQEKHTFIQIDDFPKLVKARVLSLDISREVALLGDFFNVDHSIGMRELIRVQPLEPIEIELKKDKFGKVRGFLVDVSREGIAVCLDPRMLLNPRIAEIGMKVSLTFHLPMAEGEALRSLSLHGKIIRRINDRQKNQYILGLKLIHDTLSEASLAAYINQRESEIIKKLKANYYQLLRSYSS